MESFKGEEFAALFLGMQSMQFYPGHTFLRRFVDIFSEKVDTFNPTVVTTCFVALAEFGYIDAQFADAVKRYFILLKTPLEIRQIFDLSWAFAVLSCLDGDVFRWLLEQIRGLDKECNLLPRYKRRFYQCLLDVYVLRPEVARNVQLDPEFERDCYASWKDNMQNRKETSLALIQAFNVLRKMGFICNRGELILGNRFAVNSIRHRGLDQRFALEADITFRNAPDKMLGPQNWRRRILGALGWGIMNISLWKWSMMSAKERELYLQRKILHLLAEKEERGKGLRLRRRRVWWS